MSTNCELYTDTASVPGRLEVSFDKEQQYYILSIISNFKSPGVPRLTQTGVPLSTRPARPPGFDQSISWVGVLLVS